MRRLPSAGTASTSSLLLRPFRRRPSSASSFYHYSRLYHQHYHCSASIRPLQRPLYPALLSSNNLHRRLLHNAASPESEVHHHPKASSLSEPSRSSIQRPIDASRTAKMEALTLVLLHIFRERIQPLNADENQLNQIRSLLKESSESGLSQSDIALGCIPSDVLEGWTNADEIAALLATMLGTIRSRGFEAVSAAPHDVVLDCARFVVTHDDRRIYERMMESFESMYEVYSADVGFEVDRKLFREQLQLETSSRERSVEKYRRLKTELALCGREANMKATQRVLLHWYDEVVAAIAQEQEHVRKGTHGIDRKVYGPYLLAVDASTLGVIVLHETIGRLLERPEGIPVVQIAMKVGRAVEAEVMLSRRKALIRSQRRMRSETEESVAETKAPKKRSTQTELKRKHMANSVLHEETWPEKIPVKIGGCLIDILIANAKVPSEAVRAARFQADESSQGQHLNNTSDSLLHSFALGLKSAEVEQAEWNPELVNAVVTDQTPAFTYFKHWVAKGSVGTLRMHSSVAAAVEFKHWQVETRFPVFLPMVVPPRPWALPDFGGYIALPTRVMRTKGSNSQTDSVEAADLSQIYNALDVLAEVPWRVNTEILDVVEAAWEDGGDFAELPTRLDQHVPVVPPKTEMEEQERKMARRERRMVVKKNAEMHSLRCDLVYKMEVARQFRGKPMYFPHNIDFRGRAYPVPPHLQHMGSDVCRGMLLFDEARPLGERGHFWLKVQLANLYGVDKVSFDERAAFADANMDQVLDSAKDPLGGSRWWVKAENPWQCLATCFELAALAEHGDAATFMSRLPVHMDGSCNGLQHYAALGRDALGGASVNLSPSDRPQDVYMGVCDLVRERVARDAAAGDALAKALDGRVDRKIVKQTVMTSVYGVTFVGARAQILKRLKERDDIPYPDDDQETGAFKASFYLAKLTIACLGDMFSRAQEIMEWLSVSASTIARTGMPVSWVTPLGLPVVQPYRHSRGFIVTTALQRMTLTEHNDLLPVSGPRQKSAFPPNFVHSLDSAHMMMTAMACKNDGITFAAVHDSFWTHGGSVDAMNAHLRSQFVALHSKPLLEDLAESFRRRYPTCNFGDIPDRGKLNIDEVIDSDYFFA